MKKFIKNNLKILIAIVTTLIISISGTVYAVRQYYADQISFTPNNDNKEKGFDATNVEDALNLLYNDNKSEEYNNLKNKVIEVLNNCSIASNENDELDTLVSKLEQLKKKNMNYLENLFNTAAISDNYNLYVTPGKKYLIFQTQIDDNSKTGIISGGNTLYSSGILDTGGWRSTSAHGRVMLVNATSNVITVNNSGPTYSTLSKAIYMQIPE